VVEIGDFDDTWNTSLPYNANSLQNQLMPKLTTVPQTGLQNRLTSLNIGMVVGGGSTVNGMSFDRGSRGDYDAWEQLGNPGWGWDDLQPYFRKVKLAGYT
jgi:choline dehydrogenase-like flavoprotein